MRKWYVRMCWEAEASNVEARTGIEAMQKIKPTLKKKAVVSEATAILEKECVDLIDDTIWVAGKYLKNASFTVAYRRFVRCASNISIVDWKYCQEKCPRRKRIKND